MGVFCHMYVLHTCSTYVRHGVSIFFAHTMMLMVSYRSQMCRCRMRDTLHVQMQIECIFTQRLVRGKLLWCKHHRSAAAEIQINHTAYHVTHGKRYMRALSVVFWER